MALHRVVLNVKNASIGDIVDWCRENGVAAGIDAITVDEITAVMDKANSIISRFIVLSVDEDDVPLVKLKWG